MAQKTTKDRADMRGLFIWFLELSQIEYSKLDCSQFVLFEESPLANKT